MKHFRTLAALLALAVVVACTGDSPTPPVTPASPSFVEGDTLPGGDAPATQGDPTDVAPPVDTTGRGGVYVGGGT